MLFLLGHLSVEDDTTALSQKLGTDYTLICQRTGTKPKFICRNIQDDQN